MTVQHAIVAFPNLELADQIESVRRRFDPLAPLLSAHITLVFPFIDSMVAPDLERHVRQAVADFALFNFALSAPTLGDDGYLYLNVYHWHGEFRAAAQAPLLRRSRAASIDNAFLSSTHYNRTPPQS